MTDNRETQCCPRFDPEPWHDREITWEDRLFVKDTMRQFVPTPLPGAFGKTVARRWEKIEDAAATADIKDFIMLATESSPWKGEVYINVTKEVPNAQNVRLSGTYVTKPFDGPYNAVPKWIKEIDQYIARRGRTAKRYYFCHTTCPKCARIYGHIYVVASTEV